MITCIKKCPIPVFNFDKIADLSILEGPAVGIDTPKRLTMISPDESTRKCMKVMRKESLNEALGGNLGIGPLGIGDASGGL